MDLENCIFAPSTMRVLRLSKKLTQSEVAEATGVAQPTVSLVENPRVRRPIALRVIRRLCQYYGIELWELLWLDAGAPKPSPAAKKFRRRINRY